MCVCFSILANYFEVTYLARTAVVQYISKQVLDGGSGKFLVHHAIANFARLVTKAHAVLDTFIESRDLERANLARLLRTVLWQKRACWKELEV